MLPVIMENFMLNIKGERKSDKTIRAYRRNLKLFVEGIFNGEEPSLEKYGQLTTEDFMNWLNTLELASSSLNQIVATLRKFYNYLIGMQVVTVNIPQVIGTIKSESLFTRAVLTQDEVVSLVTKAREVSASSGKYIDLRNEMIINIFIGTGLRIEELHNINVEDINIETGELSVVGKRNKRRTVFLQASKLPLYESYLKLRDLQKGAEDESLFLSRQATEGSYRLSIDQIRRAVVKLAKDAEVKTITPHSLRHTNATISIQNGAKLEDVSKNLGHSTIAITEKIYVHQTNESARRASSVLDGIF